MRCLKCRPATINKSTSPRAPSHRCNHVEEEGITHHVRCAIGAAPRALSSSLSAPYTPASSHPPPSVVCDDWQTLVSCDMPCIFHDEKALHPFSFLLRVQALKMLPVRGQGRPRERVSHGLSHSSIALVVGVQCNRCGCVFILSMSLHSFV